MRYDTMEVREQDYSFPRDPTMTVRDPDSPDTRQRRAIQKALTTAKKQDGKVRKIKEMLAYRQQQWEVFSKKMKTNFLKQERQFHEDMDKLNAELTQAQAQGKEAAALMQRLASGQTDMEEDEPVLPDTAWETLLNASAPDPDSYPEEALRAARQVRIAGTRAPPEAAAPVHPSGTAHRGAEPTPPPTSSSLYAAEPPAGVPYQASPSGHVRRVATSPCLHKNTVSPKQPRESVKKHTKPEPALASGPSLSDKLTERRAKELAQAFAAPTEGAPAAASDRGGANPEAGRPPGLTVQLDDDEDEEIQQLS